MSNSDQPTGHPDELDSVLKHSPPLRAPSGSSGSEVVKDSSAAPKIKRKHNGNRVSFEEGSTPGAVPGKGMILSRLGNLENRLERVETNLTRSLEKLDVVISRLNSSGSRPRSEDDFTPETDLKSLALEMDSEGAIGMIESLRQSRHPRVGVIWDKAVCEAMPGTSFALSPESLRARKNWKKAMQHAFAIGKKLDPAEAQMRKIVKTLSAKIAELFVDEEDVTDVQVVDSDDLDASGPHVINPSSQYMFDPTKPFRMGWDLCAILPFLLYLVIVMPFRLGFQNEAVPYTGVYWFEFFIDMIFLLDIVLTFRTGYFVGQDDVAQDEVLIEYDRWQIAKTYLKTWFILDVVSGIPFALLELIMEAGGGAGALKSLKSLKILRFLKLGRLLKLEKIFSNMDRDTLDRLEDFFQAPETRTTVVLVQLGVILTYVCHLLACGFVFVGRSCVQADLDSWFTFDFAGPFAAEDTTGGRKVGTIYLAAFYFCLTTMTSVGYGDIITHNNTERVYTICVEFVGAIVFAMIIASLSSIVSSMDVATRRTAEQLDTVASFVAQREFPDALGRRIRRHFRHYYSLKSEIDEGKIFSELSASLRRQVSEFLIEEVMGVTSVFMAMPPLLWPKLLPLLKPLRFEKDETVQTQNEECTEMFVVLNGQLAATTIVVGEVFERMRNVLKGGTLNTLCVLGVWPQCIETVKTVVSTELYAVGDKEFNDLFATDADRDAIGRMRLAECQQYKCVYSKKAPTQFGHPLYLCHFSKVYFDLQGARIHVREIERRRQNGHSLVSPQTGNPSRQRPTGDRDLKLDIFTVADLVDMNSMSPFNEIWRCKTKKAASRVVGRSNQRASNEESESSFLTLDIQKLQVRWMDINVPFEKCALRIRIFETTNRRHDQPLGQAVMKLADLVPPEDRRMVVVDRWFTVARVTRKPVAPEPKDVKTAITKQLTRLTSKQNLFSEAETVEVVEEEPPFQVKVRLNIQRPENRVRRLKPYLNTFYDNADENDTENGGMETYREVSESPERKDNFRGSLL